MPCKTCGHGPEKHDLNEKMIFPTEWCNVDGCYCKGYINPETAEHPLQTDGAAPLQKDGPVVIEHFPGGPPMPPTPRR